MANLYTLKNTRNQAVIKIIGSGTTDIALSDLLLDDQELDDANAQVAISRIVYSSSGDTTIKRGGDVIVSLATGNEDFNYASLGAATDHMMDANIQVITSETSTVFLVLSKQGGFIDPNFQEFFGIDFIKGGYIPGLEPTP